MWPRKQKIVIDRTMVVVAVELAAAKAAVEEITRQTQPQLKPDQTFSMTNFDVRITDIDFGDIKCDSLNFEWK